MGRPPPREEVRRPPLTGPGAGQQRNLAASTGPGAQQCSASDEKAHRMRTQRPSSRLSRSSDPLQSLCRDFGVGPRPTKTPTAQLEVSPTAATRPPAQSGRGALAGAVGHRHRPGVPLTIVTATSERSARATGPSLTWSSAARSQSVSTARYAGAASPPRASPGNTRLAIMRHGRWRSAAVIPATSGGLDLNDNAAARLGL